MSASHLFICTGNTCRSQMAEALAQYYFPQYKYHSAGLEVKEGMPTSKHAVILLAQAGIVWHGTSQKVTPSLILNHDHIWVMTQTHRRQLIEQLSTWQMSTALFQRVKCLAGTADIQDPYGSNQDVYAYCLDRIKQCLQDNLKYA